MSNADKDKIIEEFTKAYQKAKGKTPTIESKSGWYSVDGGKNMRLNQLEELTASLKGADTSPTPDKATKKTAASTTKSKSSVAKKPKSSNFSVKAFWQEKIASQHPGSRSPR